VFDDKFEEEESVVLGAVRSCTRRPPSHSYTN